jgi:uncharacterized protein
MRFLAIFIALAIIVVLVKRLWPSSRPPATRMREPGQMVQCAHCGIYIPEQEALHQGDQFYCSRSHLDANSHKPS